MLFLLILRCRRWEELARRSPQIFYVSVGYPCLTRCSMSRQDHNQLDMSGAHLHITTNRSVSFSSLAHSLHSRNRTYLCQVVYFGVDFTLDPQIRVAAWETTLQCKHLDNVVYMLVRGDNRYRDEISSPHAHVSQMVRKRPSGNTSKAFQQSRSKWNRMIERRQDLALY